MATLERRLDALETNQGAARGCHVCRDWGALVIRIDGMERTDRWPETPICPHCGRVPQLVSIGRRDDGPQ